MMLKKQVKIKLYVKMDVNKIRKDFPILKEKVNGHKLVYVDNSATTQKPKIVIDSLVEYYTKYNSNVHRGIHTLSEKATSEYENVRNKVAKFINCSENEIVFTKGTTDSLNLVAFGLAHLLKKGDEIVISQMEHHANFVPWQEVAKRTGAILKFIPIKSDFTLDLDSAKKLITSKTKIVSVTHISNVLGTINPIKKIADIAHSKNAIFIVDGAQSIPHMKIDVKKLGCDFFAFSSHKMCGPTGVGVLYGKYELLEKMNPIYFGGDMIYEVEFNKSTYAKAPIKFEAGTPNISDVIAFGSAINYLESIGMKNIEEYEKELTNYFLEKVKSVEGFELFGSSKVSNRCSVFSFNIKGVHSHDVSSILDNYGIAIRGGHHCAMPLMKILNTCATSRISLYFYNTKSEIDYIIKCLKKVESEFEKGEFLLQ